MTEKSIQLSNTGKISLLNLNKGNGMTVQSVAPSLGSLWGASRGMLMLNELLGDTIQWVPRNEVIFLYFFSFYFLAEHLARRDLKRVKLMSETDLGSEMPPLRAPTLHLRGCLTSMK